MVKVSTGPDSNGRNKKVIWIDSNIHGREWIAGATGTWILNELLTNATAHHCAILDQLDFYVVPMLNPDGYEYSRTSTRMWKKTRSVNSGSSCRGSDPNINWSFHWGTSASSNPCSDMFKGPSAFSEPETQAVRDVIRSIQGETAIWAYITLQSYAQLWHLPWSYGMAAYPPDYPELLRWGQASIAALGAVHGTVYQTGTALMYGLGGTGQDYAKSEGIKFAATVQLRDTGAVGYLLPPAQIIPTGQETWAAVLKTAVWVIDSAAR